ncbi:MAG: signal peptidase II [Alphaproteobacteria bacterium]|nr:MAG: signal peptidase II [Alphaproteobacteria bacterium]
MLRAGLAVAALVLLFDQLSKWWIIEVFALPARGTVEVLPFFNLTMVWNRGISFGLLPADSDLARWILVAITASIAVAVVVWLRKAEDRLTGLGLGLILGGAVGNIIDRIVHGAVADFVQLHAFGYSFYVFNVADAAITIGVALLLWDAILSGKEGDAACDGQRNRQDG